MGFFNKIIMIIGQSTKNNLKSELAISVFGIEHRHPVLEKITYDLFDYVWRSNNNIVWQKVSNEVSTSIINSIIGEKIW